MATTRKHAFTTEDLLVAALYALNKAPRFRVETDCGQDSYDIAAAIDRHMESTRYVTAKDWSDLDYLMSNAGEPLVAKEHEALRKKVRAIAASLRTE